MAFLLVGAAGLLDAAGLIPVLSCWRYCLLAIVVAMFSVLHVAGPLQGTEATWLWMILGWISAGILRVGGLTLFQLYPLLMAMLGCGLLLQYAKNRVLGR